MKFPPHLIDIWKNENKFSEFINYDKVEEYRTFGGIRIEDDVLITDAGHRVLGIPIPKTIEELSIFTVSVALQLFAYYEARELDREIDKPRNLAKSVTVE